MNFGKKFWIFFGINSKFPTLIGSVGGWVFVLDVIRGLKRRKNFRMGTFLNIIL